MLHVTFNAYNNYVTDSLYQWDINRQLVITGLDLETAPEIHFANADIGGAIVKASTLKDGVITVPIPNAVLQSSCTVKVYIGVYEGKAFNVIETIEIPVKARKRPNDYRLEANDEELYSFNALETKISDIEQRIGNIAPGEGGVDVGTRWFHGTTIVPTGVDAKTGDYYFNTKTGEVSVSTNGATTWRVLCTLKGETGETGETGSAGADGTKWYYGTVVTGTGSSIMQPSGTGAKTGDFYLNTNTGDVYVSTNGEVWWKYVMCLKS